MRSNASWAIFGAVILTQVFLASPHHTQAQAPAEQKELVAVMELDAVGATKVQAATLSDRLREELLATGRFRIVDRAQMDKLLAEQALQQTGCTSQECAVQVGKVLGVRKMVSGKASKIEDDLWLISCTMVDVETAETVKAVSLQHEGAFRSVLADGAAKLVAKLTEGMGAPRRGDAKIELTGVPEDAEVFLNGAPKGRGPLSVEKLPPGDYELVVKQKGYREWKKSARLVGGGSWKSKYAPERYRVAIYPAQYIGFPAGFPNESFVAGSAATARSRLDRNGFAVGHGFHRNLGDESLLDDTDTLKKLRAAADAPDCDFLRERGKVLGDDFVHVIFVSRNSGVAGKIAMTFCMVNVATGKVTSDRSMFPSEDIGVGTRRLDEIVAQFAAELRK